MEARAADQLMGEPKSDSAILLRSAFLAAGSIAAAAMVFPTEASLVAVFLAAFAQVSTVDHLLERNRRAIWEREEPPIRANGDLARSLVALFVGTLLAYVTAASLLPRPQVLTLFERQLEGFTAGSITAIHFGPFLRILPNNALLVMIFFLLAVLYRSGGILLVLCWNASVWGTLFAYLGRFGVAAGMAGLEQRLVAPLAILPHLALEVLAYVLAAMSGVFLSKAVVKYDLGSASFERVRGAVLTLALLSFALILVAAALESFFAPWVVRLFLAG